jgi:hypothetical protein
LLDQLRDPQPAAALAVAARDLEYRDLAGDVAELNRAVFQWRRSTRQNPPGRALFMPPPE